MSLVDVARYLNRIGYSGSLSPTLDTLRGLVGAHVRAIAFENVDVLLGRPIVLDAAALEQKLLVDGRGGYCFEQNSLLLNVLEQLGFAVTPLSARVRIGRRREETPPRTHLFLRVELSGASWLVDVGVGGLSPTAPLLLEVDTVQVTPHESRRLVALGSWEGVALRGPSAVLLHQVALDGQWQDVCEFTLEPMPAIDREVANWYTSQHPRSHFRDRLMVARATERGRLTLLDAELVRREPGAVERVTLRTHAELHQVLQETFAIVLPPGAVLSTPGLAALT